MSDNKENSRTQVKIIFRVIIIYINLENLKIFSKKFKIVVDRKVVLRYNVTRWRRMEFGAFQMTYELSQDRII